VLPAPIGSSASGRGGSSLLVRARPWMWLGRLLVASASGFGGAFGVGCHSLHRSVDGVGYDNSGDAGYSDVNGSGDKT
jgi:hypothetical protein